MRIALITAVCWRMKARAMQHRTALLLKCAVTGPEALTIARWDVHAPQTKARLAFEI